jgi:thiol-disulfide isomerase/thioredoxin
MKRRTALMRTALVWSLPWATATHAAPALPGQRVQWPDVTLLDGRALTPAQLQDKPTLVVFWTTTCPFCRRHNQHLEKLHRAAQAGASPLRVLAVARERDAAVVKRYAQAQGYTFDITLDHLPLAAALSQRQVIPLTVWVDRHSRLQQVLPGEMFEEDVMEFLQLASQGQRS